MRVVVPKEIKDGEKRVALVPDIINKLTRLGFDVVIESGAGTHSQAVDAEYKAAGATISDGEVLSTADAVLSVQPLTPVQMSKLKKGAIMGAHVVAATPTGKWAPNPKVVEIAKNIAAKSGGKVEVSHDPEAASKDASVLYTDVWMSMGDSESERDEKVLALSPFAVTENLFSLTNKDSIFMHCLPAHRGEEVEASVIDGPRSVIWREAYHRRTTIQSLLFHLTQGDLKGN